MVLLEFSIYPLDKGDSLSPFVARCLDIVDRSGLNYRCHAMGTVLEGELDQAFDIVKQCFQALATDCSRIDCSMKIDYRRDRHDGLEAKVASVEQKLGRPVHH
jgi:uncharacterized protein (TIGR00106 family)